jgi:hypothetical protein
MFTQGFSPGFNAHAVAEDCVKSGDYTKFPDSIYQDEKFLLHLIQNISLRVYITIPEEFKTPLVNYVYAEKIKGIEGVEDIVKGIEDINLGKTQ